jgi:Fic family protein
MSTSPWLPGHPHDALPPIPPLEWLETRPVLRACITARAALAGLKMSAQLLPNQGLLISTLPVLEAQASSALADVVTTPDKLFENRHAGAKPDPVTKEALRTHAALLDGYRSLVRRPLRIRTAVAACSAIMGLYMGVRRDPDTVAGHTVYTPPAGEAVVRGLLEGWERFLYEEHELDPVIRLAAAHHQFEAIHPFADGNGRTGRVLNSLFLVQEDLLPGPILCLSRYLLRHREACLGLQLEVTRSDAWEPWLLFMLEGVRETAQWTVELIENARTLSDLTDTYIRQQRPKIHSRGLVEVLFCQPYCRIEHLVEAGVARRQTASRYLKELVDIGVLEERKAGRDKLFVHPQLLRLLTGESTQPV